jgi:hypothetical protein
MSSDLIFTPTEVSTYYAARVPRLKQVGREWRGPCPIHGGKDDNFAAEAATGNAYCFSVCNDGWDMIGMEMALSGADFKTAKAEVYRIVGRAEPEYRHNGTRTNGISARTAPTKPAKPTGTAGGWREVARYPYQDRDGNVLFEAVRYLKPNGEKAFRQCRPNGHGGFVWNLDGIERVPYRLPKVLNADMVYLPEGEKDVHTLEQWGLVASCNSGGAGSSGLYSGWADYFLDRHIIILPDNDEPGRKHAAAVAAALLDAAASVRIVELPGLPAKGDVTDWRDAGGTFERFHELTEAAAVIDAAALSELRARWGLAEGGPHQARSEAAEEWPKPLPIRSELPPVESFSPDLLPESFRPLVADVTERMQVPIDYAAAVIVLCLAGAVNRRAVIQPKAHDTSWVVVPNLWGGIIGPPGFMKSPVMQVAIRPLNQIQTEWRSEHEEALEDYALTKEEYGLRHAAWKEQFKAASKSGKTAPDRPEDEPEEPKPRRLIVNDATCEALHQTMSENPAGILVTRDELTGWLSQLDRAGREGERAFCLEAWNGDSAFTMDRIGRGSIHVPHCCMSMLGGIQPGRLRSYLVDALKDGPSNDGLFQRFQLLVWPDAPREFVEVDRPPDALSQDRAAGVFRKLVELDAEKPARFRFAPDAQELFFVWRAELEAKVRGNELHPALISHLSKYRKLMPALALLFELADWASFEGFDGSLLADSENFVSLQHTQQAAAWCDYLESHARRVYSCIVTPQMRAARELAEKIKERKIGAEGFFSCRDVYLKGWSGLDSPESVRQAAEILQDAEWLREISPESGPAGGRPSNRYQVNPRVWE